MKQKESVFVKNGVSYPVHITYRYQRNIYFRYKDDGFHVSAPYFTREITISRGIEKFFDRLMTQYNKKEVHYSFEEDYFYLLGERLSLSEQNIKNDEELQRYLMGIAIPTLEKEVRKYEQIMDISKPYKIKIKDTRRQYGSNSKKTHTLSFKLDLIHYSLDIIDTVVVHELAHEFVRNHQKDFYDVVYQYSPNYKILQKKLKKGIHQ